MSSQAHMLALGTDYETFVRSVTNDQLVSAIPIIGGDKDNHVVLDTCEIHPDNVLAEVNTRPESSKGAFVTGIQRSLDELNSFLLKTGHTYVLKDTGYMPEKELRHILACEFGCEPDYDVFTREKQEAPSAHQAGNFRTAGGHIHISYMFNSREDYFLRAYALSLVLSLGTTIMGDSPDRRNLYGKGGRVRFKPYGVEVRTPSNVWLQHKEWVQWVWDVAKHICGMTDKRLPQLYGAAATKQYKEVIEVIDLCDKDKAEYLLSALFKTVQPPKSLAYIHESKYELGEDYFLHAYHGTKPKPKADFTSLEHSWHTLSNSTAFDTGGM